MSCVIPQWTAKQKRRVISAAFIKCYERPDTMHTTGCRTLMVDTAGCLETVKLILPATLSGIPPPKMSELASGRRCS
ncbi:hypothetical protein EB796_004426 [Bugula neritina]|uniref:Uncharacterized protein n=1 Tax=Bugula neritina TaxID=10212 RepID=A0A7J7KHA4_BUGNE|nr:hypothetical protein EB796_004426 [Bugula neritina]